MRFMPGNEESRWLAEPLSTPRLRLRPTRPADRGPIIDLVTDDEVRRYLGGAMSREQAEVAIRLDGELWGHFAITELEADKTIGTLSFARKRGPWEISYCLRRDRWGKGLAAEATSAALEWFFAATGEDYVIAVTQTANRRSGRLLERLGAHLEGEFEQHGAPQQRYELTPGGEA